MGEQINLIHVPHYGWLCILIVDGEERYRGEYRASYYECLTYLEEWKDEHDD